MILEVVIPGIVLKSLNVTLAGASRRARFQQASSARKQRADVAIVLASRYGVRPPFGLPVEVTIIRLSPGELDQHDNLPGSAKHVTDSIAEWFGHPDKSPGFTWRFEQRKARHYAVGIRIVGGMCQKAITCGCCGTRLSCCLDPGHAGPCKARSVEVPK
jgi:hypothetical protein